VNKEDQKKRRLRGQLFVVYTKTRADLWAGTVLGERAGQQLKSDACHTICRGAIVFIK